MRKVVYYLGNRNIDYRSLMKNSCSIVTEYFLYPISNIVIADQTHSDLIYYCTSQDRGRGIYPSPQIPIVDGLITDTDNVFLLIRTADCYPVLLYDDVNKIVCALHSGREGTRKNISGKAVKKMITDFNCHIDNIKVIIGAGICKNHYQVGYDVWEFFYKSILLQELDIDLPIECRIDIQGTIYAQLKKEGVDSNNITKYDVCTYENEEYFSYRRNGTNNRQINIIGISDDE